MEDELQNYCNPSLTGAYLRAQLRGDAARVIAGFQLTNDNYANSVTLVKDRFGLTYKLVDAHYQALRDLPSPSNNVSSLFLVTIIFGKLSAKTKQNLVRSNKKTWSITELQAAILDEINILEMGSEQQMPHAPPTASFHAGAKKSTTVTSTKGKPHCPFCSGPHIPSLGDLVKDSKQRCKIVRQNRLCFNCLGHHKVSACNS